jgi:hypothetical protein
MKLIGLLALSLLINAHTIFAQDISPLEGLLASNVSTKKASQMWSTMNTRTRKNGECFNRAHVWSYDFQSKFGVNTRKYLIYYTKKYRKELDNKWGFHIAPMVKVQGVDYVFDRKFHDKPYTKKEWAKWFLAYATNKLENKRRKLVYKLEKHENKRSQYEVGSFMYNVYTRRIAKVKNEMKYLEVTRDKEASIQCKKITHISEFEELNKLSNNDIGYCYLQEVSMYYWGPPQLRELAYENKARYDWDYAELETARKEAFKREWNLFKKDEDRNSRQQRTRIQNYYRR